MTKEQIEQIRIDIKVENESALSMMICNDGTIGRQGNGSLPPVKLSALGKFDDSIFKQLIDLIDERLLDHAGVYDIPEKKGQTMIYTFVLLGQKPLIKVFEFRLGTENTNGGNLLPHIDKLTVKAVELTNNIYEKALKGESSKNNSTDKIVSTKKWWEIWK